MNLLAQDLLPVSDISYSAKFDCSGLVIYAAGRALLRRNQGNQPDRVYSRRARCRLGIDSRDGLYFAAYNLLTDTQPRTPRSYGPASDPSNEKNSIAASTLLGSCNAGCGLVLQYCAEDPSKTGDFTIGSCDNTLDQMYSSNSPLFIEH